MYHWQPVCLRDLSTLLLKVCHSFQYPLEGCKKQAIVVNRFRMFGPGSQRHWVPNESHDVILGTHLGAAHDVPRE